MGSLRPRIAKLVSDEALPLRLTLLILLLRPPAGGAVRGLTWLAAGAALVFPDLTASAAAWLALAALVGARLATDWPFSDNHIYLLAYWCLGLGLCLRLPDASDAVARMSRWLVGSVFLCAILWKGLLTPDFLGRCSSSLRSCGGSDCCSRGGLRTRSGVGLGVSERLAGAGSPKPSRAPDALCDRHLRGTGRGLWMAVGGDGMRTMPAGSDRTSRGVRGRVHRRARVRRDAARVAAAGSVRIGQIETSRRSIA